MASRKQSSSAGVVAGAQRDLAPRADRNLPPEALRALAEAEERRRSQTEMARPKEIGGRGGLDPVRFGDWEAKGIACDF